MKCRFIATLVAALMFGLGSACPRVEAAAFAGVLDSMQLGNSTTYGPVKVAFDPQAIGRYVEARSTRDTPAILAMIRAKEVTSQPYGLPVTVYRVGPGWREVEVDSGSLKGKTVYVDERDLHYAGALPPPPVIVAAKPRPAQDKPTWPTKSTDQVKPPLPDELTVPRPKVSHWRPAPPPIPMGDFGGGWGDPSMGMGMGMGMGMTPWSGGKTVHVRGHMRDGHWVQPHWRRPPRR